MTATNVVVVHASVRAALVVVLANIVLHGTAGPVVRTFVAHVFDGNVVCSVVGTLVGFVSV